MSRNVSSIFVRLSLKAGAKVQLLFYLASIIKSFFLRKITFVLLTQSLYELVSFWGGQR